MLKQMEVYHRQREKETGITLVALVVTIVILIILAVISINIVFNEGGIVDRVEKAKEHQANAEAHDIEMLGKINSSIQEQFGYVDSQLIKGPKLAEGMIPVKWDGVNWIKTTFDDSSWYNYANKEWANVVLSDSTFNEDILDETKPYSQLVWIPRFAYKITNGWHSATSGTIDVVFVGTDNQGKDGVIYNGTYSDAVTGITSGGAMKNFVVNPAFDYGDKKLEGFWIGKFESSHTGCTIDKATGDQSFTGNEVMQIKANITSWKNITIGNSFDVSLAMNKTNNPYGLSSNDNIVDPHLVKNTEWGACAYLSKSKYGKETEEVFINNSGDYITGNAGETASEGVKEGIVNAYHTVKGQKASTTGNIYGVYDMSGGTWERVAAYINNNDPALTTYGSSIVAENMPARYKEIYELGANDTQELNYEKATSKYGDAIYETSNSGVDSNSAWYQDYTGYVNTVWPFFYRGGRSNYTKGTGVFAFSYGNGYANLHHGFRVTVTCVI